MITREEDMRNEAVREAALAVMLAARTAPKTKGVDNLVIMLVDGKEMERIADDMDAKAEREPRLRGHFDRDALNVRASQCVVLVGVADNPTGMNCGWCGVETCASKPRGVNCAFNAFDLGIAVGSMASALGARHVDNRVMYSVGEIALKRGLFPEKVSLALGIPLAASGKSVFFDRKPVEAGKK